ncbi:MAG: prevent-host-death protein [Lactobacillus ruminis]|nr:prevent-host-death protein [Ligilactobacillus ruminis]
MLAKILRNFTDKAAFFACLSVSKTHFTDKSAFFNDLSVNFWQL